MNSITKYLSMHHSHTEAFLRKLMQNKMLMTEVGVMFFCLFDLNFHNTQGQLICIFRTDRQLLHVMRGSKFKLNNNKLPSVCVPQCCFGSLARAAKATSWVPHVVEREMKGLLQDYDLSSANRHSFQE